MAARNLIIRLGADVGPMTKEMKKAERELVAAKKAFGKQIDGIKGAFKGIAIGAAGIAVGIGAMTKSATDNADSLVKLSDVTGIGVERLQELKYIGGQVGVELETIAGAQAKLTKTMYAAKDPNSKQAKIFKQLGINVLDVNGNLKDAKDIMNKSFDALSKIGNETERDAIAMQVFGKSAMELNPIIKLGGDKFKTMADKAKKMGIIISEMDIRKLDDLGDLMPVLKAKSDVLISNMVVKLAPAFEAIADKVLKMDFTPLIKAFGDIVDNVSKIDFKPLFDAFKWAIENKELVAGTFVVVGTAIAGIKTALFISDAVAVFKTGMEVVKTSAAAAQVALGTTGAAGAAGTGLLGALGAVAAAAITAGVLIDQVIKKQTLGDGMGGMTESEDNARMDKTNTYANKKNTDKRTEIKAAFLSGSLAKYVSNNITGASEMGIASMFSDIPGFTSAWSKLKKYSEAPNSANDDVNAVTSILSGLAPKLAKGGLVSATTLAIVGDNKNAKRDPEVIAPLSKLQGILERAGVGGGGGTTILEIDGTQFGKIVQRSRLKYNRVSGNPRMA